MPPPPMLASENSSALSFPHSTSQMQQVSSGPYSSQQPSASQEPHAINFGMRQLLRPPQPMSQPPKVDIAASSPRGDHNFPQAAPTHTTDIPSQHVQFGHDPSLPIGLETLTQMNPQNAGQWQAYQHQYMHPFHQIKAESISVSPRSQQGHWQAYENQWRGPLPQEYFVPSQQNPYVPMQGQPFSHSTDQAKTVPSARVPNLNQPQSAIQAGSSVVAGSKFPQPQDARGSRRRQRSSTFQITNPRAKQQRRLSPDFNNHEEVTTPPLNARDKIERAIVSDPRETNTPGKYWRAQARDSRQANPHPMNEFTPPSDPSRAVDKSKNVYHRQETNRHFGQSGPPRSAPGRKLDGFDEESDENTEEDEDNDDDQDDNEVTARRNYDHQHQHGTSAQYNETEPSLVQRMATRRALGAYRAPERRPLSNAERQNLELRYCARVSMIIGSKRCVLDPPVPYSRTKNIFTIMREKFGHLQKTDPGKSTQSAF